MQTVKVKNLFFGFYDLTEYFHNTQLFVIKTFNLKTKNSPSIRVYFHLHQNVYQLPFCFDLPDIVRENGEKK